MRIRDLRRLHRGDQVEARFHGADRITGRVERTAPGLGMLWIREAVGAPRRALNLEDFSIWRLSAG